MRLKGIMFVADAIYLQGRSFCVFVDRFQDHQSIIMDKIRNPFSFRPGALEIEPSFDRD